MKEKLFETNCGSIHYWVSENADPENYTLIFLPGLTADHRLFDKQIEYFEGRINIFVWDAPGHAASWPFSFEFTLEDKARWLNDILEVEGITKPVIVGQSMGGYVGQMYGELFGDKLKGFISIDSAPLGRAYITTLELSLLKYMEPVYKWYPWKWLLSAGSKGVATSAYGQKLMLDMMMTYNNDKERYAKLAGHGYKILAEAIEKDLPYILPCPSLLICGEKDRAGSCRRYNKAWHKATQIPLVWIAGAGHNSNTDAPEQVNELIETFVARL